MGRLFLYPSIKKTETLGDKSGPRVLVREPYYRTDFGEISGFPFTLLGILRMKRKKKKEKKED
jgi:hypothetical protein